MKLSNPPTTEQIKALAELPHGQKDDVIKANGLWDYENDPEYQEYDLELTATAEMEVYGNTTVWAKSMSDARNVANTLSSVDIDWGLKDTCVRGGEVVDVVDGFYVDGFYVGRVQLSN